MLFRHMQPFSKSTFSKNSGFTRFGSDQTISRAAGLHGSKLFAKVISKGDYQAMSLQRIHNFILPTNSDKVIIIAIIESIEVANP